MKLLATLLLLALLLMPASASAAVTGLKISPVRQDLTLAPGSSVVATVTVENLTGQPVTLQPEVLDFEASSDESGQPRLLPSTAIASAHSFKKLVTTPAAVTMAANGRQTVSVQLKAPTDALPGGYYGALRFGPAANTPDSGGAAFNGTAGVIFLVTISGKLSANLTLQSLRLPGGPILFKTPTSVEIRLRNDGNVHAQPFGKLVVKNWRGRVVSEQEVNNVQPRGSVLPGSIRKFSQPLPAGKYFGKYSAEISLGYNNDGRIITGKQTFYVLPVPYLGAGLGGILLLVALALGIRQWHKRHPKPAA